MHEDSDFVELYICQWLIYNPISVILVMHLCPIFLFLTSLRYFQQAMYNEFSTSNIQIDKDFSAKLSGYGFASCDTAADISNTSTVNAFFWMIMIKTLSL